MAPAHHHRIGPEIPESPVVIAVPHAGRHYPAAMADAIRVPVARLIGLEDRHADLLVAQAADAGATIIVGDLARAWIDLNRDPRDLDPTMVSPPPLAGSVREGPRVRAGLGLVPRRLATTGEIWRSRIAADDIAERIASVHAPYHAAIAAALVAARSRHGRAVLIDCHSMPPLTGAARETQMVIGDLDGRAAARGVSEAVLALARGAGFRTRHNQPYAGGHTLAEHGRPEHGVDAIQVEVCRTLYLDPALRDPGAGLARVQAFVAHVYRTLGSHAAGSHAGDDLPMAAE